MSIQEERFTAIANAIREKDGTTAPISANDFVARILAIQAGSDFAVPLVVSTSAGASITAVNGNITVAETADGDGTATLILTAPGIWAITASLDGDTNVVDITVDGGYAVEIKLGSKLPAGYTQVEYILSGTESQIATGYNVIFNKTKIVMDMEAQSYSKFSNYIFIAKRVGGVTNDYFYMYINSSSKFYFRIGGNSTTSLTKNIANKRITIDCDFTKGIISIDGDSYSIYTGSNNTGELSLFYDKSSGNAIVAKIYSAKIYQDDVLMRDFIPCINPSGDVGLYDIVNDKFYGNASGYNSGKFTAGPAV